MRKIIGLLFIIILLATAGVVLASPGRKYGKAVTTPFPQPAEKDLQKVIFIRYAPGFQKDKPCDYDGVCDPDEKGWCADCKKNGEEEPKETACYGFLSSAKPRWSWVEDYHYSSNLGSVSSWATELWDGATSATIFGAGVSESYGWGVYDYRNAITYGNYPKEGVIAVTAVWYRGKDIYEYDIMFDTDYFSKKGVDLNTVALHEFGHGAGLDDLYDVACKTEVMYGYYEGVKIELQSGDITGIQTLYGK